MLNLFYKKYSLLDNLKIKNQNFLITKDCVGLTFYLYNGKKYIPLFVKTGMIGTKIGQYSFTKKIYLKKKKNGPRRKSN